MANIEFQGVSPAVLARDYVHRAGGSTSTAAALPFYNVADYGAAGDAVIVTDAAVVATSTSVTSASLTAFTGTRRAVVVGAGAAGATLITTIICTVNGTGTLGIAASTTVSGAQMVWGTDDTAAIQAAITAASAAQGVVCFTAANYAVASAGPFTLPKGVTLRGTHTPSADPNTFATGTTLVRVGNQIVMTAIGSDRSTNRIGANLLSGIRFFEPQNISSQTTLSFTYADSVVMENLTFWQSGTTLAGHAVSATECWDWRLRNIITKGCGLAASNVYAFNLYNGAVNSCNDWDFIQCRFQEAGGTSVYFDSSGLGSRNTLFDFVECKFEDARGGPTATVHVDGTGASNVTFFQTDFGGANTMHANVQSGSTAWVFIGCLFSNLSNGAAQSVYVQGSNCKLLACHFNSMTVTQLMNITGGNCSVIACTQSGTAAAFNSGLPITTTFLSPQLAGNGFGSVPNAFTALGVGNAVSGATTQYGVLANPTFGSDGTSAVQAVATQPKTAAASYTAANVYGVRLLDAVKGSGSTITAQVGIQIDNQTQGANNFAIRTGTGAVSLGDVLELTAAASNRGAGKVGLGNGTQTTVGAAGAASALPAAPLGYLVAYVSGTKVAIPYYTA